MSRLLQDPDALFSAIALSLLALVCLGGVIRDIWLALDRFEPPAPKHGHPTPALMATGRRAG